MDINGILHVVVVLRKLAMPVAGGVEFKVVPAEKDIADFAKNEAGTAITYPFVFSWGDYRLVIQRQRRIEGDLDIWEGEYTYRCILTNDYKSSVRDIVEFYNLRGGKERIFDDMNNGFGWNRLPKSFMAQNTV